MLELDGLVTTYDAFQLGPIDLTVENEVVSVLGPSGSGKTTLLSTIAGITAPDAGTVTLNGMDLTERPPEKRATALVFQEGALFPHMTAKENIKYASVSGQRVEELAETLEIVGILEQRADTLSGGERQRVALARSLAADPAALLLDEPLANLDTPIKRRLRDELRDLLASLNIPVVYVTHDQRQATVMGDQIAVMEAGTFHQTDIPTEVFDHPATPFVASFTGSINLFQARVIETDPTVLEWDDRRIETSQYGPSVGDESWFCIRPEYVTIAETRKADRSNVFDGRIIRRLFEGDDYRVTVTLDGISETIEVKLSPSDYDRLDLDSRERVQISLEKDAIHLPDAERT